MNNNTPELTDAAAPEPTEAAPEPPSTTLESTEAAPEPGDKAAREAAKYRRRLREVEAERDRLAGQVEALQRGVIERLCSEKFNLKPEALWAAGYTVADLVDEGGRPDEGKVEKAVYATAERFGIRGFGNVVPRAGTIPKPPIDFDLVTWRDLIDPYKN